MTYDLSTTETVLLLIALAWEFLWKGIALWRASRLDQPGWFIALLVIGSVGILPIAYLITHHEYHQHMLTHRGAI